MEQPTMVWSDWPRGGSEVTLRIAWTLFVKHKSRVDPRDPSCQMWVGKSTHCFRLYRRAKGCKDLLAVLY